MWIARTSRLGAGQRGFQSRAEFKGWLQRVVASQLHPPRLEVQTTAALMLCAVDPIASKLLIATAPSALPHSPAASLVQVTWPLATDRLLRSSVAPAGSQSPSAMR